MRIGRTTATVVAALAVSATAGACAGGSTTATDGSSSDTTAAAPASVATTASATKTSAPATSAPTAERTVFAFPSAASVDGWVNQDDPVMGGLSRSAAAWRDGALVFSGTVSLENHGGFASVLSPRADPAGPRMVGATGLALDATGDGRTYVVQLRPTGRAGAYIQRVSTEAGVARTYALPLAGFEPVDFMLQRDAAAPPLDPTAVGQVAIYVTDGQEGPFTLEVRRLAATGTAAAPTP